MLKYIFNDFFKTVFFNWQNYFNLWIKCKSIITDMWIWHLRLKHAESQSLQHLITCFKSAQIQRMQDSITIDCNDCAAEKISWKICCKLRFNEKDSEEHLVIDFHDFKQNTEDFIFLMTIINYWSDFIWDFYLFRHTTKVVIKVLIFFLIILNSNIKSNSRWWKWIESCILKNWKSKNFLNSSKRWELSLFYSILKLSMTVMNA